ncbi:MAG: hypothetical protein K2N38_00110 [Oscillospiraceae bacterium]|nr:hypothetical protein [Oscillospiraceae bacterium]
MEGVNLTQKMITIHTIFVVSVCLVFGGMNMASEGGLAVGIGIAVLGLAVGGGLILFKDALSLLTRGIILSTVQLILIIVASSLRHELHGMFPLMLASMAIAAIYFDRRNLTIQFVLIDAASLIGLLFKDFFYGEVELTFIIKGLLGVNVGAAVIIYLVKCCLGHIAEANKAHHEASELVSKVQFQSSETERLVSNQKKVVQKIADISQSVSSSSDRMLQIADTLSATAEEQTSTISEITSEIASISEQTEKSLVESEQASQLAKESVELLEDGNTEVSKMAAAMSKIEHSSKSISSIVKTIENIAFQTNILALNASTEAARAGAAGKGFAVVANEVRVLADKSSKAVSNTASLITASMNAVKEGKEIADNVQIKMQNVMEKSEQSAARSELISKLTREQAESVSTVRERMDEIAQSVTQSSEISVRSSQIAEQVAEGAKEMEEIVSEFRLSDKEK